MRGGHRKVRVHDQRKNRWMTDVERDLKQAQAHAVIASPIASGQVAGK